jgi:hypothetical protein
VSPVKYDLGFYIPEDGILHSRHRENLKSYIDLTLSLCSEDVIVSSELRTGLLYTRKRHSS